MSLDDEIIHIEDMPNNRKSHILMVRDAAGKRDPVNVVIVKIPRDGDVEVDIFYDDGVFSRRHVEGIRLTIAADVLTAKEGQQR